MMLFSWRSSSPCFDKAKFFFSFAPAPVFGLCFSGAAIAGNSDALVSSRLGAAINAGKVCGSTAGSEGALCSGKITATSVDGGLGAAANSTGAGWTSRSITTGSGVDGVSTGDATTDDILNSPYVSIRSLKNRSSKTLADLVDEGVSLL